jgi:glutathione S-transferase
MGADYSIADISLLGWVRNLIAFTKARELVGFDRFLHVQAWLDRGSRVWRWRAASDCGLETVCLRLN